MDEQTYDEQKQRLLEKIAARNDARLLEDSKKFSGLTFDQAIDPAWKYAKETVPKKLKEEKMIKFLVLKRGYNDDVVLQMSSDELEEKYQWEKDKAATGELVDVRERERSGKTGKQNSSIIPNEYSGTEPRAKK